MARRRPRRRRPRDENPDHAPPPPADDGSWSAKKTLIVTLCVFGVPSAALAIFGRGDIVKAFGIGVVVLVVAIFLVFQKLQRIDRFLDDD